MAESGFEADSRRLNVLLQPDGSVRIPARLTGFALALFEGALRDVRRAGRGGGLGFDVLETLDALQRGSDMSENGRIVESVGRIVSSGEGSQILTAARAAELLECDPRTVRRAFVSGRLRGRRLGHEWVTTRKDLDEFRFGKKGVSGGEDECA